MVREHSAVSPATEHESHNCSGYNGQWMEDSNGRHQGKVQEALI